MYNFVPTLNEGFKTNKGPSTPLFSVLANRSSNITSAPSNDPAIPAYKKVTGPSGEKLPRMHSCWIPAYLKILEQREICKIDDGYRLYEKFPRQRAFYRGMWVVTGLSASYTFYSWVLFMRENRP